MCPLSYYSTRVALDLFLNTHQNNEEETVYIQLEQAMEKAMDSANNTLKMVYCSHSTIQLDLIYIIISLQKMCFCVLFSCSILSSCGFSLTGQRMEDLCLLMS